MPDNNKELIHIDFGRITPSIVACVAGVKRVGEGGIWARVVSRPNSLPLPFRTPATRATSIVARVPPPLSRIALPCNCP